MGKMLKKLNTWRASDGKSSQFKKKERLIRYLLIGAFVLLCLPGCSRKHYREDADHEVYSLLNTVNKTDPLWEMSDFSLEQDPNSRYANVYDPDKQPMPPDDPTAHRLMEKVDGKKGSSVWTKNGCTNTVENLNWNKTLPAPVDGKIMLDRDTVFDLALVHSPEYRAAFENVYSSALQVTLERYAFDVLFYGGESLFYDSKGGLLAGGQGTQNKLTNTLDIESRKKFATGAEAIVGIANSMVWTFTPNTGFTPTTTLGYSFTQPFLRGAGRAVVLESLTLAERQLLANVRQLVFYQQGFYMKVIAGTSPIRQPGAGGYPSEGVSTVGLGGFFGLLSEQVQIYNQQENVIALQNNLNRYEELFKAGQVSSRVEVDRVRQNLLSGQNTLLTRKNTYQNSVESYLISLGLPPYIGDVVIEDVLLDQFRLMSLTLDSANNKLTEYLTSLRNIDQKDAIKFSNFYKEMRALVDKGVEETNHDLEELEQNVIPKRSRVFQNLEQRLKKDHHEMDASFFAEGMLQKRVRGIRGDFERTEIEKDEYGYDKTKGVRWVLSDLFKLLDLTVLKYDRPTLTRMLIETKNNPGASPFSPEVIRLIYSLRLEASLLGEDNSTLDKQLEQEALQTNTEVDPEIKKQLAEQYKDKLNVAVNHALNEKVGTVLDDPWKNWVHTCLTRFSDELMTLRLVQARTRLESLQLTVIDVKAEDAFRVASEYRLDWMNVRAQLVDEWRNIEIVANTLRGVLDLNVDGSVQNDGSNPLNFSKDKAAISLGVQFDAPLNRLAERNAYRRALISYDQTRRSYYTYVDNVYLQIRTTIRAVELAQLAFELTRENVLTAIQRVHQSQLALTKPPKTSSKVGTVSSTAAMDLVDSLTALLSAQNSLMTTWLEYRIRKMNLLLMLGIFELDETGRWKDPGDVTDALLSRYSSIISTTQDDLSGINKLPNPRDLIGADSILNPPAVTEPIKTAQAKP